VICAAGREDLEISGIITQNQEAEIPGISSGRLVLNTGGSGRGYRAGDTARFVPDYTALPRFFAPAYIAGFIR
jgi:predicted amino acid racemase